MMFIGLSSAAMSASRMSWVILAMTGLLTVQGMPPEADPGPLPNPLTFPQGITLPDGITPDNFAKFLDETGRSLPSLPGDDVCGNQDFLSNMLVYQYLSGSISDNANTITPVNTPTFTDVAKTTTSISTSLTTLLRQLDASTHFSTSTTSYVTTITSSITTVVPVIFRGSKVITTLTDINTEVITATEFFTTSSVVTPSIVQTLPVEITLSITSTKGFNGDFTLADLSRGASKVIDEPIQTSTFDLGSTGGLDISNLNLGGLDLSSLSSLINSPAPPANDEDDLIAQLTALLGGEDKVTISGPGDQDYFDTGVRHQEEPVRRNNFDRFRKSKFQPNSSPKPRDPFTQFSQAPRPKPRKTHDTPFNVVQGFQFIDKPPAPPRNTKSGSATQNTRFSKFHKRTSSTDNKKKDRDPPADRERGRFSASERRQAFSRAEAIRSKSTRSSRKVVDNSRFKSNRFGQPQSVTERPRPFGQPQIVTERPRSQAQSRLISSGILKPRKPSANSPIIPARPGSRRPAPKRVVAPRRPASPKVAPPPRRPVTEKPKPRFEIEIPQITPGKTTKVFTMYLSGNNGETITTLRTVTLRNLRTRYRREATNVNDATEIIDASEMINIAEFIDATKIIDATSTYQIPIETQKPYPTKAPTPKEVLTMLKKLDPKNVKQMLKSLQKWVSYYSEELLEPEDSVTTLKSSLEVSKLESDNTATVALPVSSVVVQSSSSNNMYCPATSIVTETVYHTVIV